MIYSTISVQIKIEQQTCYNNEVPMTCIITHLPVKALLEGKPKSKAFKT